MANDHIIPCEEIKEMRNRVAKNIGDIKMIRGDIYSNGKEGLMKRTKDIESYIDEQRGGLYMLKSLIVLSGFQGLGLAVLFLKIFKVI